MTDASGALVSKATITITHVATNTKATTQASTDGRYLSIPLRIGGYRVEAEASGFKRSVRDGVILEIQGILNSLSHSLLTN